MTAPGDLEWLTERGKEPEGSVVDCELRELPQAPADVLETIAALAEDWGLEGHAGGGRGRWGIDRRAPYMHATVRVAAAPPGTAVTVQISTLGEAVSVRPLMDRGWVELLCGGAVVGAMMLLETTGLVLGFSAYMLGSWGDARAARQRGSRLTEQSHWLARQRGTTWRREFWAELGRRLATRSPFRSSM